jgi:tetratricopeptide (TPR) repeat protein
MDLPSPEPTGNGASAPPAAGARRHLGPLAGVLLLGLFAYANSLHGPFVFDDRQNIRDSALVRAAAADLASPALYRAQPNRYVAYLTFAVNYRLGGTDVVGYHAVNLAIHLACALLVYALVALTFRTPRLRDSALAPSRRAIAFAAAALFVTHPLQTQAVTYVVQRITSLAALLYVASVVLYARWRLAREEAARPGPAAAASYALALLAAVAAMRTKEIAFTLPFAIVLYELSFFPRRARRAALLAPFLATALLIPATLLQQHGAGRGVVGAAEAGTRVETALSRLDYLRTEITVVVEYLRLLVLPTGQNLDPDHPIYRSFLAPRVLASLALLLALGAAAAWLYRRTARADPAVDPAARLVAFGLGWFFLALLVESSLIPIDDVMNEHRVYLPSVGFFAAAATGGALLLRRVPRIDAGRLVALLALLLAIVLGVATIRRNAVWASELSLWADAASKSPNKARPHGNLAVALAGAGYPHEGVLALRRAVRLAPDDPIVRGQLGAALASLRRYGEAEVEIREAIRLDPTRPEPLHNLALLLASTGRSDEAKEWLRRSRALAPAPAAAPRPSGAR